MMEGREKKRGLVWWARSLVCLVTVAALTLGVGGCGKGKKERVEELTGRERVKAEVAQLLRSVGENADPIPDDSLDLTVSLELGDGSFGDADLNDYLKDSSLGLRVEVQEDRLGMDGDVTVMGQRFIGGTAIYDDGTLGFQVPELDSTYYTIDLKALLRESYEGRQYLDMLERMENMGPVDFPAERVIAVTDRYIDLLADTATKDNTVHEKRADFAFEKLTGVSHTGQSWTFTPTAADMEGLVNRLANELEGDEALKELVMDYLEWATGAMGLSMAEWGTPEEIQEELEQMFSEAAQSLRDSAADAGAWMQEAQPQCVLYTAKDGAWKAETTADDGDYRLCAEGGANGFALWMEGGTGGSFEMVFQYEERGGQYAGTLTYGFDMEGHTFSMELAFEHVTDKLSALGLNYGSYTLTIPNLGKVYFDVTEAPDGGTDHVLSLDIPALAQECRQMDMPDFNTARLTLHTTDTKTEGPTPKGPTRSLDLPHMDYAEMNEIFGPWGQRLEGLTRNLLVRVLAVTQAEMED